MNNIFKKIYLKFYSETLSLNGITYHICLKLIGYLYNPFILKYNYKIIDIKQSYNSKVK